MRIAMIGTVMALAACTVSTEPPANDASPEGTRVGDWVVVEEPPPGEPPATVNSATSKLEGVSACLVQDGEKLAITPLKAIGTEPFWGARIEGRCVTYSTPEDQDGTRIWTKYAAETDARVWTGTFQNKPFRLIIQAKPDCSDGMSDRIYPMEVTLMVGGEERRGCAAPE